MAIKKHLSLPQAAAHLQITERKLRWWCRSGIIESKVEGKEYLLGRRALLMARLVDHMTEHVSLQAIRPHMEVLRGFVNDAMWCISPNSWIVVMLSEFAVKRIDKLHDRRQIVELSEEGPLFAIKVPLAWQAERICSEQ